MPHCPARPGPAGSTVTHQMRTILKKQLQDPAEAGGGNRSSKYCMPNCTIVSQQGFKLLFLGWSVLAQVAAFPSPFSSEQAHVFISCGLLIHTYVLSLATSKLLCFSCDPCVSSFLLPPQPENNSLTVGAPSLPSPRFLHIQPSKFGSFTQLTLPSCQSWFAEGLVGSFAVSASLYLQFSFPCYLYSLPSV